MGILSNTVNLCQFRVAGEVPSEDLAAWAGEQLEKHAFRNIDQSGEELSVGWVRLDDHRSSDFAGGEACRYDHYLAFTLRRDQRKIPAALLRAWFAQAQEEFLASRPELQRVPKAKREELREAVRGMLLARTLPVPNSWDVVWDTRSGIVSLTSLGPKVIEQFEVFFKQTFQGLRPVAIHPFGRARQVVPEPLRQALEQANRASGDNLLDEIRDNQWLGSDFLLWLAEQGLNASGEFSISRPGPANLGETFVAYLNDRMILQGVSESGVQKVAVSGPQDHFAEVRSALQSGKQLCQAVLHLEQAEQSWKMNLRGESFQFASFKAPSVKLEKDNLADPDHERVAVFFERMHVLETGLQMFDSLLARFLEERLGPNWPRREAAIRDWLGA